MTAIGTTSFTAAMLLFLPENQYALNPLGSSAEAVL
jgi:hypothetical protein